MYRPILGDANKRSMGLILHMKSAVAQTSFYTRGQRLMKEGCVEIIIFCMEPVIDYGGGGP